MTVWYFLFERSFDLYGGTMLF